MHPLLLASALALLPANQGHPDTVAAVNIAVWRGLLAELRKDGSVDTTTSVCVGLSGVSVADRGVSQMQIQAPPTWISDSLRHLANVHLWSACSFKFGQGVHDPAGHAAVLIVAGRVDWVGPDSVVTSGAYFDSGSGGNSLFILVKRAGQWTIASARGTYFDG